MHEGNDLLHIESRFRLTGEVAGRHRTFLLIQGENRVGSVSSNDIVLKAPGVSRQHALLTVSAEGVFLVDPGSKNGTFLNDQPIRQGRMIAEDEVRIGSVLLRLVEIDDTEDAMAFVVNQRSPNAVLEATKDPETEVARPYGDHEGLWLDLLDLFLVALCQGGEEVLSSALGQVARGLGVEGALLCEWTPPKSPVVRAAWGQESEQEGDTDTGYFPNLVTTLDSTPGKAYKFGCLDKPGPMVYGLLRNEGLFPSEGLLTHDSSRVLLITGQFDHMAEAGGFVRGLLSAATLALRGRSASTSRGPASVAGTTDRATLTFPEEHVVGSSPQIRGMYRELETACRATFPVLILGETGVGKEHVAKILHLSSPRHKGAFVAINCAAIPADLLEAELFGIRKGVATGVSERQGRFQQAEGGTLLLDEVGDMPLPLQAKLLRVLEEEEITPVGGKPLKVDVRIVAATNADLLEHVENERFRRDLYYRLAGYVVRAPPLRERRDDIPIFVEHFLRRIADESGRNVRGITLRALRALSSHGWPGNIRELIHEMRRLVYSCHDGEAVDHPLLSEPIRAGLQGADGRITETGSPDVDNPDAGNPGAGNPDVDNLDLAEQTATLERRLIRAAVESSGGNRSQAARLLGISRQGLAMKMERLGMAPAGKDAD